MRRRWNRNVSIYWCLIRPLALPFEGDQQMLQFLSVRTRGIQRQSPKWHVHASTFKLSGARAAASGASYGRCQGCASYGRCRPCSVMWTSHCRRGRAVYCWRVCAKLPGVACAACMAGGNAHKDKYRNKQSSKCTAREAYSDEQIGVHGGWGSSLDADLHVFIPV